MEEVSENTSCYADFLIQRRAKNLYRQLETCVDERSCIDFSSNDYLGLSKSREALEAAYSYGLKSGIGATGSRLLSGNNTIFKELEQQIAKDKNTEAALVMGSGFQTNITVLSTLLDKSVLGQRAIVFFDRLNHSSLYHAILLAGAEMVRYRHCDMEDLSRLMERYSTDRRPKFVVTETLFGMDGDVQDMERIATLTRQHKAVLYLDEAHATGILGKNGYGLSTNFDLSGITHVIMGTFSKAIGVFGSYIASSTLIKNYLINKCPGLIYSTALPPILLGAIAKAWETVALLSKERKTLLEMASKVRKSLSQEGYNIGNSTNHIVPIILGEEEKALALKKRLLEKRIIVSAVRPPTVPVNTSRIRIALCAFHTKNDITRLLQNIKSTKNLIKDTT
ncbi:8-amino-7-oxononanoate synthase [Neorickettsia risticii str. Illinois]|uniref:5-aminolevulinate synthase n=1 Tax=Neorickettsia risticii (strain Illinois) TaxID=434131 RepID=C6V596_NEORI|nr:8-amino-7-oxononanoate synthase [Neorickettsia risticii]ACT69571.1 8-amino-7-oxononanoate synthase [Neorickettsia risticii str. Illinois]